MKRVFSYQGFPIKYFYGFESTYHPFEGFNRSRAVNFRRAYLLMEGVCFNFEISYDASVFSDSSC